ncbi:MAG: alpha/beta hydrolase [Microthrixaceae bacterium]|nr:alpha/beta hydrolase [Microthrixaceae bacterium]
MSPPDTRSVAPARAELFTVDGLAVTRRARPDIDPVLPMVVFVHGAMDRAASFGRVMRRLPEFEVIAYDRRGYGQSERLVVPDPGASVTNAQRGTIASHGHDLSRVMEHCASNSPVGRSRESVVVIGHSLGGLIALWVAAQKAPKLIGIGAYESPAPWLDASFGRVGGGAVELANTAGNAAGAEFFYKMMIGAETFSRLRPADIAARRSEGDALIAELESLRDPDQAFDLGSIDLPVVIGMGTASSESMQRNSVLLADAVPDAAFETIEGAAHGAHLSRPEAFASYVRRCVTQSCSRATMEGSPQGPDEENDDG